MKPRTPALGMLVLGAGYGLASGLANRNPYYEGAPPGAQAPNPAAWNWRPSPLWLPSYVLARVPPDGIGITRTRSGYLFRSVPGRVMYTSGSVVIGGLMGAGIGWVAAASSSARRRTARGTCPRSDAPSPGRP